MAKVLVIEDDDDIRQNIEEILGLAQHEVATASNGKEGVEKAHKDHHDLIISDVMMPLIDGFGVLHILRKDPSLRNIPFVFLTSRDSITDLRCAMTLGACNYIVKPFEVNDLLSTVESTLKNYSINLDKPGSTLPDEQLPDLSNHTTGSLASLIESSEIIAYSKKDIVYKEGSIPRFVYFIKKGKIKTYKSHADGKDLVVGLFGENDFIGYATIIEDIAQVETAEVIEDAELVLIPRRDFEKLLNNDAHAVKQFLQILARKLNDKKEQVLGLAYNTLRKKVANALITLGKKYHLGKGDNYSIEMSREELASIAGTATESLIRTLKEFKQEKIIDIDNGIITIVNESRLQNLSY